MKAIYSTTVAVDGGREGHARSSDGALDVALTLPKEFGGPDKAGATNPEQLFAAGYAACFNQQALPPHEIPNPPLMQRVMSGPREAGGFQLAVVMELALKGISLYAAKTYKPPRPSSSA